MQAFKTKINQVGRIIIPAHFRRALNLKTDEELVLHVKEDEWVITSLRASLKKIREKVKKYNASSLPLTENLKSLREEDDSHA